MSSLSIVRHGQDVDNASGILNGHRDTPLTELGRSQAHALSVRIVEAGLSFSHVYCSPLRRARETAQIIAAEGGFPPPVPLQGLIERDFGVMTGVHRSEIAARCAPNILETQTVQYFLCPEGAETFPQLLDRATRVLETLRTLESSGDVLLVTHGDIGKMLYASFYDVPWEQALMHFHFGNSELIRLEQGLDPAAAHVIRQDQANP